MKRSPGLRGSISEWWHRERWHGCYYSAIAGLLVSLVTALYCYREPSPWLVSLKYDHALSDLVMKTNMYLMKVIGRRRRRWSFVASVFAR
jgi:hypothetical protein